MIEAGCGASVLGFSAEETLRLRLGDAFDVTADKKQAAASSGSA